jgi:hypothetical protein
VGHFFNVPLILKFEKVIFKINPLSIIILCLFINCNAQKQIATNPDMTRKQDSLAFELCQIYGLDQGIRKSDSFENKMKLIQAVDEYNFSQILKFIKLYGFPTKKLLGEKNVKVECVQGSMSSVLLHNPHKLVLENECFSIFLNEIKKGNLTGEYLATVMDKYYWTISKNKNTPRVFYGSQFGKPCIQTKETTNKARVEIGLKPLNDDEFVDCEGEELDMPKERR